MPHRKPYGLPVRFSFLICIALAFFTRTAAAGTLILSPGGAVFDLAPQVEILEDSNLALNLAQVQTSHGFLPNPRRAISIGRTASAIWLRFKIDRQGRLDQRWAFEVGKQGIGALDLYLPERHGAGQVRYRKVAFGTWRPYPPEHIASRMSVVSLPDQLRLAYFTASAAAWLFGGLFSRFF